jgi:hypothetical protein
VDPGNPGISGDELQPVAASATCVAHEHALWRSPEAAAPCTAGDHVRRAAHGAALCGTPRLSRARQPGLCVRATPCAASCLTPHAAPGPAASHSAVPAPCVAPEDAPRAVAGLVSRRSPALVPCSVAGFVLCASSWPSLRRVPWLSPSSGRCLALWPAPQPSQCLHATLCAALRPTVRAWHPLPGAGLRLLLCPQVGVRWV